MLDMLVCGFVPETFIVGLFVSGFAFAIFIILITQGIWAKR